MESPTCCRSNHLPLAPRLIPEPRSSHSFGMARLFCFPISIERAAFADRHGNRRRCAGMVHWGVCRPHRHFFERCSMKKNVLFVLGCAVALGLSSCGREDDESSGGGSQANGQPHTQTTTKTVCQRIAEGGEMSEYECEESLKVYQPCRSNFENILTCLMDQAVSSNSGDMSESFLLMETYCPSDYLQFRNCVSKNATKITVPQYCAKHESECGYFFTSSCESDYSSQNCAPQYAAFMDCALESTSAACDDDRLIANSAVQDQITQYCFFEALNYNFCALSF